MKLRWGICGSGRICGDFVQAVQLLPPTCHEVFAVAARSLDRAQAFAKDHGIANSFGSYDDLFRCKDIDVVYVGVLNHCHKDCITNALMAGKHVLCEKPMTISPKDVTELMQVASDSGKFLMEGYWSAFFPSYKELAGKLSDGSLGEVKLLNATFCREMEGEVMTLKWNGGGLMSIGYYLVALSVFVYGEKPNKIDASGVISKEGVDSSFCARLEYPGGRSAQLYNSTSFHGTQEAVIEGTNGFFKLDHPFFCPVSSTSSNSESTRADGIPSEADIEGKNFFYPNTWGLQFEADHVRDCVMKGLQQSPVWPLDKTLMVALITEDVLGQIGYGQTENNPC